MGTGYKSKITTNKEHETFVIENSGVCIMNEDLEPIHTFEVGKFYKTRNGKKVGILKNDLKKNSNGNLVGIIETNGSESVLYWYESGRFLLGTAEHEYDLIGEWVEPITFDWDCLPPWANDYIVKDKNGVWYAYNDLPIIDEAIWEAEGECIHIPPDYAPKNFTGNWKDSLFKNPNKN